MYAAAADANTMFYKCLFYIHLKLSSLYQYLYVGCTCKLGQTNLFHFNQFYVQI